MTVEIYFNGTLMYDIKYLSITSSLYSVYVSVSFISFIMLVYISLTLLQCLC